MHILLINAGSSSLKFALQDPTVDHPIADGLADWAGPVTLYHLSTGHGPRQTMEVPWRSHGDAVRHLVRDLPTPVDAVGHRIVHGGDFTAPTRITPAVHTRLAALADLAPLHNPPSLEALAAAEAALPTVPHIAVFDTAFHATLAPEAYTYPVPERWTRDWGIRRYGFHGLSHDYCARRAAEMLGPAVRVPRLVVCHLGHGCSAAAIRGTICVDTTMGFTPLEGLMMGTRSGSVDPGLLLHVQRRHGLGLEELQTALNRESGLKGVSGISADMRQVLAAARDGHEPSRLALAIYTHRVRQAIGALAVTLGGIDALVFTAGVGENAAEVRAAASLGLECLGLELDPHTNADCRPDADVATTTSRGRILVIATHEDRTMLRAVAEVVS